MKNYVKKENKDCPVALTMTNAKIFYGKKIEEVNTKCIKKQKDCENCDYENSLKKENKMQKKKGKLDKNWIINNLPVETEIPYYGKPTPVLIVDFDLIKNKFCVVNYHKGKDVWLSLEELFEKMGNNIPNKWIKTQ